MRLRDAAFDAARAAARFPVKALLPVPVLALVGLVFVYSTDQLVYGIVLLTLAGLALVGVVGWWWARYVLPPGSTREERERASDWAQRTHGTAARLDIAQHASPQVLRRQAHVLRPSTFPKRLTIRERRRVPVAELGSVVVKLGMGWWGEQLATSCEDVTARIGGPRVGKTMSLSEAIYDVPGPLITTSTRLDLAENVQPARTDRAVHVFNPDQVGGVPSTIRWNVLVGCEDYATCVRRAGDMIPQSLSGDGKVWAEQARPLLALLFYAAAHSGGSVRTVQRWLGAGKSPQVRDELLDILAPVDPDGALVAEVHQFWEMPERTFGSVLFTAKPAVGWMSSGWARDLGDAPAGTRTFDIPRLLREAETLHLLARAQRDNPAARLIASLVGEIGWVARKLAAEHRGGRLDPPATFALDELANVCPIPIDEWSADFGGSGLTLHLSFQSIAQLRERWTPGIAEIVLGNVGTLLIFGGSKSADELRAISTLTGEHRRRVLAADGEEDLRETSRWTSVMSPAEISALPAGRVLVLRRSLLPVVGSPPMIYERRSWAPEPLFPPPGVELGSAQPEPRARSGDRVDERPPPLMLPTTPRTHDESDR